ncbi:MAG: glycosyltransferase family 2 protein, partial [Conexivisphaera sp.]
ILFIDDDAVPEERWIEKYERFFEEVPDAGGASGLVAVAHLMNGRPEPTGEIGGETYRNSPIGVPWKRPLPELDDYCDCISISGLLAKATCSELSAHYKSIALWGMNMAFRADAIAGAPLGKLYEGSRKGLHNESVLAYIAVRRGYSTYRIVDREESPMIMHIEGPSLTRQSGFFHEFWLHYDRVKMYHRLRTLRANVSLAAYAAACLVTTRKHVLPRALATIYAQMR